MKHAVETKRKDARQPGRAPTSNGGAAFAPLPAVQQRRNEIGPLLRRQPAQTKVAIGPAGDRYEREADAVAARVMAGQQAPPISRISPSGIDAAQRRAEDEEEKVQTKLLQRQAEVEDEEEAVQAELLQRQEVEEEEEPVQTKLLQRQEVEEEEEPVQTKLLQRQEVEEEEEPVQAKLLQRQEVEEEEEPVQAKLLQRQEVEEEEEPIQAKSGGGQSSSMANAAQRAIDGKGAGRPLDPGTRSTLESRIGADLSQVRVHDDSAAQSATRTLGARAFTHGSDIWLGRGESQNDTRLMAHEATHTVQQGGPVQRELVQRQDLLAGGGGGAAPDIAETEIDPTELPEATGRLDPETDTITFSEILIPPFKMAAHRGALYNAHSPVKRKKAYDRGNPNQRDKWRRNINKSRIRTILEDRIKAAHSVGSVDSSATYVFQTPLRGGGPDSFIFGNLEDVSVAMTTPSWGGTSRNPPLKFFHVDHIVELQLANWNDDTWANELDNMELLEGSLNMESGRVIRGNIVDKVGDFRRVTGDRFGTSVADIKGRYHLEFRRPVAGGGGGGRATTTQYWKQSDIEEGRHLAAVQARGPEVLGREGEIRVFSTETGGLGKMFTWPGAVRPEAEKDWLAPFEIKEKNFVTEGEGVEESARFGTFMVNIPENNPDWEMLPTDSEVVILRVPGARYAGRISKQSVLAGLRLKHKKASPVRIDTFDILPDTGIFVAGAVLPELPLLGGTGLGFELRGGNLRLYKEFVGGEIDVPSPFSIRGTNLKIFADTAAGFGAEGQVDFGIDNVGEGYVGASIATEGSLAFSGGFDFESEVFDPARVEVGYENGVFRGSGEIGIPEGKVPGVKSASLNLNVDGTNISGTGTLEPAIRAIRQGTINFSYSPEAGMTIGGSLELSNDIPNVQSGSIEVEITKRPDAETYDLSAHGELTAGLPGFTATVTADYANGMFTVEGRGEYERGMLSGSVLIGATNRAVDEEGNLGDEPTDRVTAYGGGTVTAQLTPWLAGTAGIRLLPNGEIELTGSIGLPDVLEIFPEQSYERNIFSINLDIPIIGVAVAGQRIGIFATIGGGLDLSAGIGPGQLQELGLTITYNPDHEDQTHIEGGAKLVIPAHAGLRLFVRAALGAGIPIVSATLGLEMGGQLGIEGAAEAGVQIDWTPATGLVLDAEIAVYAEPKFRFDITGFAEITADLFITEITLYEKRWELAAIEVGSDYRVGVKLPYHQEGDEFAGVDWSAVEFELPDVDPQEILSSLVDRIT